MTSLISIESLTLKIGQKKLLQLPKLDIEEGDVLAIVGESGSGKSLFLKTLMGLLPKTIGAVGEISCLNKEWLGLSEDQMRSERGNNIAMVFQEPMSALNPQMKCGLQLVEAVLVKNKISKFEAEEVVITKLGELGLSEISNRILHSYPHELSGGQRQRVMIAMASINNPKIILADEPTTALDTVSRKTVMEDFLSLVKNQKSTLIWVTHELDIVSNYANKIWVLKQGELIQSGSKNQVLKNPSNYLSELLSAIPKPKKKEIINSNWEVSIEELSKRYGGPKNGVLALEPYSINVKSGETLAVIGTSGSGKTTLAKMLVGLESKTTGKVLINGNSIPDIPPTGIQMVFQDPYASLNRKHTSLYTIEEILVLNGLDSKEAQIRALEILKEVGFDERLINAKPKQMSGGQRQRLCIAKAIATGPKVLILDEAVAALDPLIQEQILTLLKRIQRERQLVYIFITHDLHVARSLADHWCFLNAGKSGEIPQEWWDSTLG